MASLEDIAVSGVINFLIAISFLLMFACLRLQPMNDRVYFPKWYLKKLRKSPRHSSRSTVGKFLNLDCRKYIRFLNWMPEALRMSETELMDHAGVDTVAYLRIYTLG
jgi:hypothetical protein